MTGGVTGRPGGPSSCENSQRAHPNHSIRRPQPVLARAPPSASITCVTQKGAGALLGPPARARPLGRPGPEDRVFLPRGTVHRSRQGPTAPYRTHGSWARTGCQQAGLGAHTLPSHSCPTDAEQHPAAGGRPAPRPGTCPPRCPRLTRVLAFRNTWLSMSLLDLLWATPAFLIASSLEYKGGKTLAQAPWPAASQQLSGAHGRPARQSGRGPGQPRREGPSVQQGKAAGP